MISMWKVREMVDKATNLVMNYTETEAKIRDATNDDPWGTSGNTMQEIAGLTFSYEHFPEAMGMLWKRMLHDNKTSWRRTYKSLLLLDYMLKNGSERVVTSAREHIYDLRTLENYQFVDDMGKDQGVNIRHKVQDLIEFIQDDDRLREERKKAKKNKDKYVGMSSDTMGYRSSSSSSSGFDMGWKDKWPKASGGGGGGGGGFKDHSEDEEEDDYGYSGNNSPVQEFKDNTADDFPDKGYSGIGGGGGSAPNNNITGGSYKKEEVANVVKRGTPKKTIDLGASSAFGQKKEVLDDIFGEGGEAVPASNNNNNNINLAEDDFDPRGVISSSNSANVKSNHGANGDFGDFDSVFGSSSKGPGATTQNDDFADFSSGFESGLSLSGGGNNNDALDLLGSPSVVVPALTLPSASNLDLLGDINLNSASSSSSAMPPVSLPPLHPLGPALFASPLQSNLQAGDSYSQSSPPKIPATWGNLGSLNINLDNLGNKRPENKKSTPMNAMPTQVGQLMSPTHTATPTPLHPSNFNALPSNNDSSLI
eukprot:TRINITY_DN452_c0_g1_i1.p1 TRINITY_DN452_c0_g1~~TRINITY_DN452_c0_g1_i1.p1  ORF type:complete len:536 (-),score=187.55 TRINITY_DN452_c0_g1_i1:354-1961(-)